MGSWQDNSCHGKGIIVTLDGMYFEGNFLQNKISVSALLVEDIKIGTGNQVNIQVYLLVWVRGLPSTLGTLG